MYLPITLKLIWAKLTDQEEFRKLELGKTQLGAWEIFSQILSRDVLTRRQKRRHWRPTLTLTSFFMVSCSRSAFLMESCSSLSRVSKCLLWLFWVSIFTSISCCWFCRSEGQNEMCFYQGSSDSFTRSSLHSIPVQVFFSPWAGLLIARLT